MPQPPASRPHVWDHRGRVAGMFDELGLGDIMDRATQQTPEMRIVTAGQAVTAMVLNGLGVVNQPLDLVPQLFQPNPTSRLLAPGSAPAPLNDDALGRTLETRYAYGVTELHRPMAATAAERLGLAPTFAHLDRTGFHGDGRDNSHEAPDERVVPSTRGDRRDHRPALNQVMRAVSIEHHAGMPVLMKPLSGNSRDAPACGQMVQEPIEPWHTTDGTTDLVADCALYREDNRQTRANTHMKWITRVPATWHEAPSALAQAAPQAMMPLTEGDRSQGLTSTDGGVEQRWVLISSESRQLQARRAVAKPLLTQRAPEGTACKTRCRTACACEAEAQQALTTFEPRNSWQAIQARGRRNAVFASAKTRAFWPPRSLSKSLRG